MTKLTCTCVPGVNGLSAAELERLFPDSSSTALLLSLVQDTGIEGYNLSSIVVSNNGAPILLLPLFETRFDLSAFVGGWVKQVLKVASRLLPSLFHPRILSVGTLIGEWSEIGIDTHTDQATLAEACTLAFDALRTIATDRTSDVVAIYNFNQYGKLPEEAFKGLNRVQYRPCARLSIDFSSTEEYLSRLSRGARKDVRRKMRAAPNVRVVHSRTVAPFLDRIYALYLETVSRGPLSLGVHSRQFFENICERVPGAEYTLYFVQEELAAFNLLVVKPAAMVDLYFCMDCRLGRSNNLYVVSWLENARSCLERNIPFYYAGQGTEKTKAHLGATFIPSFILFKHRRPLIDRLLVWPQTMTGKLLSRLGFWPAVSDATAQVDN